MARIWSEFRVISSLVNHLGESRRTGLRPSIMDHLLWCMYISRMIVQIEQIFMILLPTIQYWTTFVAHLRNLAPSPVFLKGMGEYRQRNQHSYLCLLHDTFKSKRNAYILRMLYKWVNAISKRMAGSGI